MHRFSLLIRFTAIALGVLLLLLVTFYPVYTRGELIVMDAKTHLGDKYVLSKAGENDTFDCSGLIMYCFSRYGFIFEHSAELIGCAYDAPVITDPKDFLPGDIICFDTVDDRDPSDHVGIWMGGNKFIHASSSAGEVTISSLEDFYLEHFTFGRRYLCPYY